MQLFGGVKIVVKGLGGLDVLMIDSHFTLASEVRSINHM